MAPEQSVRLGSRGLRRLRSLHPWIYADDLLGVESASHGDVVSVLDGEGRARASAFYSAHSKIALRIVAREGARPDLAFWGARISEALDLRRRVVHDTDAYRLVFAESDGIPGLIVDRYGEHLVVQALTAATEALLPLFLDLLSESMPVASVLARNDPAVRLLEGLPREVRQLRGTTPDRIEVREGGIRYEVEPWTGQKTGAFLDQRENRLRVSAYARGRVLDVFAYHGSFALHAAPHAERVDLVEASEPALARARQNMALNSLPPPRCRAANAFNALRDLEREGERYELIVLDPPAFARSRADLKESRRGYKEINLRAMKLLSPGGVLVTCSCSYNLAPEAFLAIVEEAAADAATPFRILERRGQASDHPIRLGFAESAYLKCLVLERT